MATPFGGELPGAPTDGNGNHEGNGVPLADASSSSALSAASLTQASSNATGNHDHDDEDGESASLRRQEIQQDAETRKRGTATRKGNDTGEDISAVDAAVEAFDSPELRALKTLKWTGGRALTAHVQDLALRDGKRAMVATSGGSFKKFVCSSETPCSWLVNAVRTRPRERKKPRLDGVSHKNHEGDDTNREEGGSMTTTGPSDAAQRKYWYVSSAYLLHTNCTGMAKPTARQLKDVSALKQAVQHDSKVSSSALVDQLKSQARLLCSKSMVYKAKIDLLDEMEALERDESASSATSTAALVAISDVEVSTQRLPSYLARLSALNSEVLHAVERDPTTNAHFYRALVALDPLRFFSNATPLVFGVDCVQARPGTTATGSGEGAQLVLLGCDSNLETITFATALVPEASENQFVWFLAKLVECGYPLHRANGVYCDGRWAISSACARVGISCLMQDTRYLIEDLNEAIARQFLAYQHQPGFPNHDTPTLGSDHLVSIWAAQCAESEGEFYAALHKLEINNLNPGSSSSHLMPDAGILAAQHLRALDPRRWALFPRFAASRLYGWQTTRYSRPSQQPDRPLHSQFHRPCESFKTFALTLLNETFQRHERATQWEREQRVVTPEAERMMQEEMKFVPLYDVAMSAPQIAFVWNPQDAPQLRQRRVDLQAKTCTCARFLQFGVPCRHILSVLRKINALGQSFDFFDDSLRVRGFMDAHKGHHIELPLDETLELDKTWLPATYAMVESVVEQSATMVQDLGSVADGAAAATPSTATAFVRKRRVRNKVAEERMRPLYKCRKCNIADGHNSLTCPNRRAKKNA